MLNLVGFVSLKNPVTLFGLFTNTCNKSLMRVGTFDGKVFTFFFFLAMSGVKIFFWIALGLRDDVFLKIRRLYVVLYKY